ncbi:alternative ribosome rescue aminoacyl-tRNA hydrolase ArfB [Flavobacterium sp.]|uniref:alternative ribosome rescue aminoacyl-tRNA hydrolase ArfB n=1 Tax=Flavobacterium sp. TaxID=239 RepID=UPI0026364AB2|nr:alternative ribosome rescue aminoacyl-tRNA hydrolase ArfB [Flavobacterium sp.]MDD3003321.1 alternative ribosome rescue aminoacyl-tRNA hydrolase ArfB [Flavobacterium sp.]
MNKQELLSELNFKAIRSSGPGGQNVNKVSSKVILSFDVAHSKFLSEEEKERLISKLQPRLTKENILILSCDENRSQFKNKDIIIKRFFELLYKSLQIDKKRISTKTPKSAIRKRLNDKKILSETKRNRQKPNF